MKTSVPNQFINQPNNDLLFRKSLNLMMKRLLLLLVFTLFSVGINAQVNLRTSATPRVMEVKAFITALKASEASQRQANPASTRLEHLLNDLQPTVYVSAGNVQKQGGDNPTSLSTDSASLNDVVATAAIDKQGIECVTIWINSAADLNRSLDLSVFSGFQNLKYVYIISTVDTTESVITRLVKNNSSQLGVFYKIDKGA